jgi:class I fructose-bisphosphate aldolase
MTETGKLLRLNRILDPQSHKGVIVAFDHGLMLGSIPGISPPRKQMELLLDAGMDAILVSPGLLVRCADVLAGRKVGVMVRLDWTNQWRDNSMLGFPEGRTSPVASVEDAVRWGADAVVTYMFIGLDDAAVEAEEIRRNAEINLACARFGIIHIIESMARGRRVEQPNRKEWVALHTRMAAELGADMIKTDIPQNEQDISEIVSASPIPILLAGGPKLDESLALNSIRRLVRAGASGIIFGRTVFQSTDPGAFLRAARQAVHQS